MIVFENKGLRVLQFTCEDVSHDLDVSTKKYSIQKLKLYF